MKNYKYLLLFCIFIILFHTVSAQCLPDTSIKQPGIFPDTLINLDTAKVNTYYEMVMTAVVPKDTMIFGNPIPVDSIGIFSFEGLPAGFSMIANTASSYWKGGESGCIIISGNPTSADIGVYPLSIKVIAVVGGLPTTYPVPGYRIIIHDGSTGLNRNELHPEQLIVYPNPFCNQTSIRFSSSFSETCLFRVFNSSGDLIHHSEHNLDIGINQIPFKNENYSEGLYFYSLISENLHLSNKLIIKY